MKSNLLYITISAILLISISNNSFAQCNMERHNTTWHDGWSSCEKKQSPNTLRGVSHWMMYTLGHRYILGESYWWNHNVPQTIHNGAQSIAIDYSLDGVNWIEYGTFNLSEASGLNTYEGEEGPDLEGIEARFLLITVLENYGGECAGISEVKIGVSLSTASEDVLVDNHCLSSEMYPNPFNNTLNVKVNSICQENIDVYLEDAMGRRTSEIYHVEKSGDLLSLNTAQLIPGIYFVHINSGSNQYQKKVIKLY